MEKYAEILPLIYKAQEKGAFQLEESFKVEAVVNIIQTGNNKNKDDLDEDFTDLEVLSIIKQALAIGNIKANYTFADVRVIKKWFAKNK